MEKVIEYTVAQAKGRRLRMARALTGMSRQDLHDKTGIATSTMDTWESGRVELNEKSSLRICESFRKLGIFCSAEWLLRGEGMPPHLMSDTERSMLSYRKNEEYSPTNSQRKKSFSFPPFLDPVIKKELSFFLNLHDNPIFHILTENFGNSMFDAGDCVAGVGENPQKLIGKVVILQKTNEETCLCRLSSVTDSFAEISFGKKTPPTRVEFKKLGRILWHRKSIFPNF